jgi:SNF2 family DNA or RNA helicase
MHNYQNYAVKEVIKNPKKALFLKMGSGKTTSSLTIANDMLNNLFVSNCLIIAPLRVCNNVWKQESEKWDHLQHLNIKICTNDAKSRLISLNSKADIHIINRENIPWLIANVKWRWDMVIIDESSSFKNHSSKRFRALKTKLDRITSMILLSGTPCTNSMMNLWAQIYLLDQGKRLGKNITIFRQRYFQLDYTGYKYNLKPGAKNQILNAIKDIAITMDIDIASAGSEPYNYYINLPKDVEKQYNKFEKDFLISLEDITITTLSKAALTNKLLQFCNGAIYDNDGKTQFLHDEKINALKDIIEDNPNENFLIAYNYKSDLERIQRAFPKAKVLSKNPKDQDDWNKGKIKMLLAHPASAGHGLNLQHGGNIVIWFGLNWSLELYQQFNARLDRQGQSKKVRIIHIVTKDCLDEKVLLAWNSNAQTQDEVLEFLKHNIKK